MAKQTKSKSYKVRALKSAAGEYMLRKGRVYEVPAELPEATAQDYLQGNLVEKIKSKSTTASRSATTRETR